MQSSKDILLEVEKGAPSPTSGVALDGAPAGASILSLDAKLVSYPPSPSTFPEAIILDDLSQVKKDIDDLSKSCLVGKMLGAPIDRKMLGAPINPGDLFLVWSERPGHV